MYPDSDKRLVPSQFLPAKDWPPSCKPEAWITCRLRKSWWGVNLFVGREVAFSKITALRRMLDLALS